MNEGEKANAFRKKEMEQKQTPEVESSNFFCSQTHKFLQLFQSSSPAAFPLALTLERSAAIIAVWTRPLVTLVLATALQRKPIGNDLWGKKKKKKKSVVTVEISMNTFRKGC